MCFRVTFNYYSEDRCCMVILIVTVVMVADDGVHLLLCELYTRSLVAV